MLISGPFQLGAVVVVALEMEPRAPRPESHVELNLASARGAFNSQTEARAKHKLWLFYVENNLIHEAGNARKLMLEHLRTACAHWRAALGIASPDRISTHYALRSPPTGTAPRHG